MTYTYIDGDNIGLKIETCFLENDEIGLSRINEKISTIVNQISDYLITKDQKIIFSGADGIISKGPHFEIKDTINYIRNLNKDITFSLGSGQTLKDAYIALRYAKSKNKNIAVILSNKTFSIIK